MKRAALAALLAAAILVPSAAAQELPAERAPVINETPTVTVIRSGGVLFIDVHIGESNPYSAWLYATDRPVLRYWGNEAIKPLLVTVALDEYPTNYKPFTVCYFYLPSTHAIDSPLHLCHIVDNPLGPMVMFLPIVATPQR